MRRLTGDYPAAAELLEQALELHRALGNLSGEAEALNGDVRVDYTRNTELFAELHEGILE
ncbi:hypothetical protein OG937_02595 [Streptomyces sp. NBC_00510]